MGNSMDRSTHEVLLLSEAVSPITHAMGTAGNESIIAREKVITPAGAVELPFLSANALRHRCIREPGAMWLVRQWNLVGRLSVGQLNFLMHGGNLTESNASENTRNIGEFQRLFPLLRLLGGCLPNQILTGSMDAWRGTLVCEENRPMLSLTLPAETLPVSRLRLAEEFVGNYQYTRGDATKANLSDPALTDAEAKTNLMIYSGQAVRRGAQFVHGFLVKHASNRELGALLLSLRLWQATGGTIGGQAAKGHGRLHTWHIAPAWNEELCIGEYVDYALAIRDEAVEWLNDMFLNRPAKEKKEKGKSRAKKEATPA